jgi:hypothetical protein
VTDLPTSPRIRVTPAAKGLALLAALGLSGVAMAQDFNPLGDGSDTNNADLLRDPTTGCENCDPIPPHEWGAPPFKLDWSLALRGAYVRDKNGDHFEALVVPSVTFTHEFLRGTFNFNADAELSKSTVEDYRVNALRIGLAGEYQLNADTTISGEANLNYSQGSAGAPGTASNVAIAPRFVSGDASAEVTHDFGLLTVGLRGDAERTVYGPSTLSGGALSDNSDQNTWQFGTGLRIGYKVTPILTAFVDGSAGYQMYDLASPTYGAKLDAADYAVRTGLAAKWNEVLEAEASVGVGLRRFTETGFSDIVSQLYDASITFRPDETLEFRGALATTVGAPGPDSGGTARIEYAVTGDVGYQVNPWLKLRGNAGYSYAILADTTDIETGYSVGTGADYLLNEHVTVTADYVYANSTSAPDPAEEEHRVTVGMTLKR